MDSGEISRQIGYSFGYTKRLVAQAKKYNPEKILKSINLLLRTDKDIKTGKKSPNLAIEMLIAEVHI